MADVLVSYKSDERGLAGYVVALLETAGFSVWWDQRLGAGSAYDRAIVDEVDRATCVVVCWSSSSIHSDWVRGEAKLALDAGKLIPVKFDKARILPPFNMQHTIDLSNWHGSPADPAWVEVIGQVRARVDPSGRSAVNIANYSDTMIGKSGHMIHKLKARDSTGQWAYYFVLVPPNREKAFNDALAAGNGIVDLSDYGMVIASCYGQEPNQEIRSFLKARYGFNV